MLAKMKEEYRRLSREELLKKVYDLGAAYEINSFSCSQSAVAALYRVLDFPDALVKAASSNAGGTAMQLVGTCGGLVGGIMVLDYFFGRPFEHMSDKELIQDPNINDLFVAQPVARSLVTKYIKEYGTITCANIQLQLFGRFFYLEDPDEFKKLDEAGAHSNPEKCPRIVGNAARWTMEILLDNGAVKLG
ncbi:MAG: C-GCAxxG-C-C family protein [Thermodesulfobacteriota bacterium]|jgi:hypothetical protein